MRWFNYFVLFILVITTISCSKKEKVKIAIMTKLSSASIVGSSEVNAGKMFMERHNITDIDIYLYDDKWLPEESVKQFKKMREDGIDILITSHVSGCVIALEDMINTEGVFCFVTGATTDVISNKDDLIFRNIQDVISEQYRIADYINERYNNILIIRDLDNFAYTEPALKYFTKKYKSNNFHLIDINISNLDYEIIRQKIEKLSFDSLYLLIGGYQVNAGNIAQLVHTVKPNTPVIYTPWMKSPTLLETAGKSIDSSVIASHYPPYGESQEIIDYLSEYQNKFGELPTYISLNVYTALEIIYEAIKKENKTPQTIKNYILNKRKFNTRFGEIEFNEYGDIDSPLYFIDNILKEFKK